MYQTVGRSSLAFVYHGHQFPEMLPCTHPIAARFALTSTYNAGDQVSIGITERLIHATALDPPLVAKAFGSLGAIDRMTDSAATRARCCAAARP
jgi:hypothetical protein